MKTRRRALAAAVAAVALMWQGPVPTAGAQTEPGPTITVTPATDLVDGQVVEVTGTGYAPLRSVWLAQCPTGMTDLNQIVQYCGQMPAAVPDAFGEFSVSAAVMRQIPARDCSTSPGICSIVVIDLSVLSVVAEAPIDITDGPTLSEYITLSRSRARDGDIVTVTGEQFSPGVAVDVAQCARNLPVTAEWCAIEPATAITDATGAFTVDLTIERAVTFGSGALRDCVEACVVAAFTADGEMATADLTIAEAEIYVPPTNVSATVTPQGTVHIAATLSCSSRYGGSPAGVTFPVDIDATITQVVEDRTISVPFEVSTTCGYWEDFSWEADVIGHGTERFKVGPASLTVRANEAIDPYPDDDDLRYVEVDLVRPAS